jgi:hypothetical protein
MGGFVAFDVAAPNDVAPVPRSLLVKLGRAGVRQFELRPPITGYYPQRDDPWRPAALAAVGRVDAAVVRIDDPGDMGWLVQNFLDTFAHVDRLEVVLRDTGIAGFQPYNLHFQVVGRFVLRLASTAEHLLEAAANYVSYYGRTGHPVDVRLENPIGRADAIGMKFAFRPIHVGSLYIAPEWATVDPAVAAMARNLFRVDPHEQFEHLHLVGNREGMRVIYGKGRKVLRELRPLEVVASYDDILPGDYDQDLDTEDENINPYDDDSDSSSSSFSSSSSSDDG